MREVGEDAVLELGGEIDNFPEIGADGGPLVVFADLEVDFNLAEAKVVAFGFQFFSDVVLEIEQKGLSECREGYAKWVSFNSGMISSSRLVFDLLSEQNYCHLA